MNSQSSPAHSDLPLDPSFGWDLGALFGIVRRRAWLVALIAVAAVALGGGYLVVTPPLYEAKTVVQVEQQAPTVVNVQDAVREDLKTVDVLKTIEQNLASTALLLRVAKAAKLDQDPRFTGEKAGMMSRVTGLFREARPEARNDTSVIRTMNDRVKIALRRGTRLIDITVRGQNPELARELSLAIVGEYTRLNFEQKLAASKPAYDYIVGEAERLKKKLEESEQKLQAYREEKQAVSLEQTQNIVVETLKDLNKSLSAAQGNRIKLESDVASIAALQSRPSDLLTVAGIGALPEVLALKERISQQDAALASLAERFDTKHPAYRQAQSEVEKLKLSLTKAAQDAAGLLKASLAAAKETEQKTLAALQEQEKRALDLNKISIQYNVLTREVESDRVLYDSVLRQIKETQIIQGVDQGAVRVVEPATLPDRPVSPKKSVVLALALFIGLSGGSVLILGPAVLKGPLVSAEDAERHLGTPAIGAIPKVRINRSAHQIFLVDNPRSPAAEALRTMRAALSLNGKSGEGRTFLFSSALPQEGKTFCAVNFAAALALEGHRTLLIDGDLRVPSIGHQFFGKEPVPGLAEVLQGKLTLSEAVRPAKIEKLHILTAGANITRPSELLGSAAPGDVLAAALEEFERIVIDSAPVLAVSDTLLLARHVQRTCLVVRAGSTPGRAAVRAQHLLTTAAGRPLAGVVLNQVPVASIGYGSYGSYGSYA